MSLFFSSWKTIFKQSWQLLDTSQYLAYLLSSSASFYRNLDSFSIAPRSIEKVYVSSIATQSIKLFFFALDTCSIAASIDPFKTQHLLTPLDLSRITKLLYIGLTQFGSHFSRSLSIPITSSPSKTFLSLTPNFFLKDFSA